MLDWFVNPNHGLIVIAQERGYFADQGLEVEIKASWPKHTSKNWLRQVKVDCSGNLPTKFNHGWRQGLPLVRASTLLS